MSVAKSATTVRTDASAIPKPASVFYVWYAELCRRANASPLSIVRPLKSKHNSTILDFVADRIKLDEWKPILTALRTDLTLHVIAIRSRIRPKFLLDADTDDKVRSNKRKYGCLWTDFCMSSLTKALSNAVRRSSVLTSLELDGLPVDIKYLEPLVEALKKNSSLKILSFKQCQITDSGCSKLCMSIRFMPNIEVLNLTGCSLTSFSAQSIAKLIRHQQINRYCISWHSSLRYNDPDNRIMAGLKRITLNNNPEIGDEGLKMILDELDDDLWIKAIDMQRCNVTDKMATRILDVIDYSKSLEIADFRHNDSLSRQTIEKIFHLLKDKHGLNSQAEFQWCFSSATINQTTVRDSFSRSTYNNDMGSIQKSKSAPFRQPVEQRFGVPQLRRTKTFALLPKKQSCSSKNCRIEIREHMPKKYEHEHKHEHKNEHEQPLVLFENDFHNEKEKIEIVLPRVTTTPVANAKKAEFVLESSAKLAQNLLQKIISKEKSQDYNDDNALEEFSYYYDDGFSLSHGVRNQDSEVSTSNVSLIRYMKEIQGEDGGGCKSRKKVVAKSNQCGLQGGRGAKKILVKVAPVR